MKLTKKEIEETEEIREYLKTCDGVNNPVLWWHKDAKSLLSRNDHLEEKVRDLKTKLCDSDLKLVKAIVNLNNIRGACEPIVEKLEKHDSVIKKMGGRAQDDIQWYTDIPLPIARRIAELVKGGMGFENI